MAFWKKNEDEEQEGVAAPRVSSSSSNASSSRPVGNQTDARSVAAPSSKAQAAPTPSTHDQAEARKEQRDLCQPDDLISQRHEKVRSALGPGTVIQGKLSFDTPVRIDGKLSGEVFSSRALIVGKTGQIDATVDVASLIVYGAVRGKIRATEKIEIYEGGSVEGEIKTPSLKVESGAILGGECDMGTRSKVISVADGDRSNKKGSQETKIVTDEAIDLKSVYDETETAVKGTPASSH